MAETSQFGPLLHVSKYLMAGFNLQVLYVRSHTLILDSLELRLPIVANMRIRNRMTSLFCILLCHSHLTSALPSHFSTSHLFADEPTHNQSFHTIDSFDTMRISDAALRKRATNWNMVHHAPMADGWVCSQLMMSLVYPTTSIAQHTMQAFFTQILSLSGNVWLNEPWRTAQTAKWGEITIKFISSNPLPQDWVHEYLIWSVSLVFFLADSSRPSSDISNIQHILLHSTECNTRGCS